MEGVAAVELLVETAGVGLDGVEALWTGEVAGVDAVDAADEALPLVVEAGTGVELELLLVGDATEVVVGVADSTGLEGELFVAGSGWFDATAGSGEAGLDDVVTAGFSDDAESFVVGVVVSDVATGSGVADEEFTVTSGTTTGTGAEVVSVLLEAPTSAEVLASVVSEDAGGLEALGDDAGEAFSIGAGFGDVSVWTGVDVLSLLAEFAGLSSGAAGCGAEVPGEFEAEFSTLLALFELADGGLELFAVGSGVLLVGVVTAGVVAAGVVVAGVELLFDVEAFGLVELVVVEAEVVGVDEVEFSVDCALAKLCKIAADDAADDDGVVGVELLVVDGVLDVVAELEVVAGVVLAFEVAAAGAVVVVDEVDAGADVEVGLEVALVPLEDEVLVPDPLFEDEELVDPE